MKKERSIKTMAVAVAVALGLINPMTTLASDVINLSEDESKVKELSSDDFLPISQLNSRVADKLNGGSNLDMMLLSGDQYEPNESIATATSGVQGKVIHATIHDETDMDFYRFEVTDNEPLSIILYDIPSGCDYDLYLFNYDQSGWYTDFQEGSTDETFYISLDQVGTYYVAVDSYSGSSSSPYSLYFGKSYRIGSTGWVDPNFSFPFGVVPRGTTKTSAVKNINLANDNSIPDGAVVEQFLLTDEGTGGTYEGFYKYLKPGSGSTIQQYGNLETMVVPQNTSVKQNWQIWGSVGYSNSFTWEPRYYIQYKFFVTPLTTRFL